MLFLNLFCGLGSSKGLEDHRLTVAVHLRTSLSSTQLFISVIILHCRQTVTGHFTTDIELQGYFGA